MKLLIVTTTLLLALFSTFSVAAAVDAKSLLSRDEVTSLEFVPTALPEGGSKVDVFSNGKTLEGTVIEHGDDIKVFDGDGKELDLEELRNEDDDHQSNTGNIERRAGWITIIRQLGKLIAKWGSRAWSYIWCVGSESMLRCSNEFVDCAVRGDPPWQCPEGMACVGLKAWNC